MGDEESLRSLLDFAVEAAWQAGKITLEYFQTRVAVSTKEDGSFLTIADRRSEKRIRELLRSAFPDHGILGEEYGERRGAGRYRWIVDPLDGTASFIRGVPFYGVLIGLERDGEAVAGVANFPALGEMVYAAKGEGCYWNGKRARVSKTEALKDAALMSTDTTSFTAYGFDAAYRNLVAASRMHRTWGDCYGHALVATGRADVMLDAILKIWDAAAFKPILEEAGGTWTDWSGNPSIESGNAISTNGLLFGEVMRIVKETG